MSMEDALYPLLPAYRSLPGSAREAVGRAYRGLPETVRFGPRYAGFRRLAAEVEDWSAEQVEAYQLAELRRVLSGAAHSCPFYARSFSDAGFRPARLDSLADLAACPTITSRDIVEHLEGMASADDPRRRRLYVSTSGSTGTPVGFYLEKGVSRPKEKAFLAAQWRRAGYDETCRVAVIRGQVVSRNEREPIAYHDPTRDWLVLSAYHLSVARLPEYLEHIRRFRPDVLHAYPSAALQLAGFLQRTGQSWPVPLRCVLAGSERLTDPQRRLLEAVFGCRVYSWYGHSERVVLAGEGRQSRSYYFWPTYGYVEFGPPDATGLREVIGTSFHNRVMPLIRYRTGDYVRVHDPERDGPREYPWAAVSAVEGRVQEFLVTAAGCRVALTSMMIHTHDFDGLYAIQFVQDRPGRAVVRYVPGPRFRDEQLVAIERVMHLKLGQDFDLTMRAVAEVEKTPRGKGRWLISSLPHATATDDVAPAEAGTAASA